MVDPVLASAAAGEDDDARRRVGRHLRWSGVWGLILVFGHPWSIGLIRDSSLLTRQWVFTALFAVLVLAMLFHVVLARRAITVTPGPVAEASVLRVRGQLLIALVLTAFGASRVVDAWTPGDGVDIVVSVGVLVIAVPASVKTFRLMARANRLDPPQRRGRQGDLP